MVEQVFRHTFDRSNVSVSKTGKLSWPFNVFPELPHFGRVCLCTIISWIAILKVWPF